MIAERRREKKYEEQDRRHNEDPRNSNIGQVYARLGRDIVEAEHERLYGKRPKLIQDEPATAVAAPVTPPEQLVRSNAAGMAAMLDDFDVMFGNEGTQAASMELTKAEDEQFKEACGGR